MGSYMKEYITKITNFHFPVTKYHWPPLWTTAFVTKITNFIIIGRRPHVAKRTSLIIFLKPIINSVFFIPKTLFTSKALGNERGTRLLYIGDEEVLLLSQNRATAMEPKKEKVEAVASYAENKLVKEIQGDIDEPAALNNNQREKKNREGGSGQRKMIKEEGEEGSKPLPHRQVPQPALRSFEQIHKTI